ncbi:hypothetical protein CALK_2127 [Chitinivibrio alkaliphilus ACht1]|uniref:Uncharacterized protein n=1 Tax=Chitinivibrio alkaliphilus ACht1 TaxID=1313304 RepID=U7D9B0_9BACT|nr:hypothetical protein CALK_2127 [Chitinivibrio alkaliphilus ACht1]
MLISKIAQTSGDTMRDTYLEIVEGMQNDCLQELVSNYADVMPLEYKNQLRTMIENNTH